MLCYGMQWLCGHIFLWFILDHWLCSDVPCHGSYGYIKGNKKNTVKGEKKHIVKAKTEDVVKENQVNVVKVKKKYIMKEHIENKRRGTWSNSIWRSHMEIKRKFVIYLLFVMIARLFHSPQRQN